jgi:YVTN family beta-propeller protein
LYSKARHERLRYQSILASAFGFKTTYEAATMDRMLAFLLHALIVLYQIPYTCGSQFFQAPALPGAQPIDVSDRIYTADQTSNTITVIKPFTHEVLGTIALGKPRMSDILNP